MKSAGVFMMLMASLCCAQLPGDFQPATTNVWGAEYPRVDAAGRVSIRFKAPEATRVKLNFWSGPKVDMQKGPDGFWKMHEKMFANQQKLAREDLDGYAKEIGLDMTKFKAALDNRAHKAAVEADDKAGTDLGISGTPAFLINGYYVSGAQPFQKLKKLIDRALNEAK